LEIDESLALDVREGLPDALRVLVAEYPREGWEIHRNFHGLVTFWLDRHMMFRRLAVLMREDVEGVLDGKMDFQTYAPRLTRLGNRLITDLHAHHHIEDIHFFPELSRLEPRLERGFALLETDHRAIDPTLGDLAGAARAVLQGGEPGALLPRIAEIERLLHRHLEDEEDLVVPVILKTGTPL